MKSVLDHFAPRHLHAFVIPLFFWQPFQQLPASLPHCQQEQRQLKCLEVPALLRGPIITISFLIMASIQIWDTNQFSPGIGWEWADGKKGYFLLYSFLIYFNGFVHLPLQEMNFAQHHVGQIVSVELQGIVELVLCLKTQPQRIKKKYIKKKKLLQSPQQSNMSNSQQPGKEDSQQTPPAPGEHKPQPS